MNHEAYLGLGTNLGDRHSNISRGLDGLAGLASHLLSSSLYETPPAGWVAQPPFLNAVCRIWTTLDPFQLLREADRIADEVGHGRAFPNAPRLLDIDLLFHGRQVIDTPLLTLPHPRMAERSFVMTPLAEIAPGLIHPVLNENARTLAARLPDRTSMTRLSPAWSQLTQPFDTPSKAGPIPCRGAPCGRPPPANNPRSTFAVPLHAQPPHTRIATRPKPSQH